jgi:FKBP-type peptidyl-prolyl cis-trans isomerase FklB
MKYRALIIVSLLLIQACTAKKVDLSNKENKQSYTLGHSIGFGLTSQQLDINSEALLEGLKDALNGDNKLEGENMQEILMEFQQDQIAKQAEKNKSLSTINLEEGRSFLEKNKKNNDVVETNTGLQYKVLKKGSGKNSPNASNTVTVHYRGTLLDGTEFDSSYSRNTPATFKLTQVISGWTEGLQYMHKGDTFKFFIPSNLAYGERGTGPVIGPNSTLIFEVELLDIK